MALRMASMAALLCCGLGACGGGASLSSPPSVRRSAASTPPDRLLELAAHLPRGADECVLARPAMLPPGRKALYLRMSQADPLAWVAQLDVVAFAAVARDARTRRSGARQRVLLLWLEGSPAHSRALLERHAGLQLAWDDEVVPDACTPDRCPLSARFVDPHVVRIARGSWPSVESPGAELRCRKLAAQSPGALELSTARSRRLAELDARSGRAAGALRSRTQVRLTRSGVRVTRVDLMPSIAAARRAVAESELSSLDPAAPSSPGARARRRQVDAELTTTLDVLWEDLRLRLADEQRARAAEQYAAALQAMRPGPDVDLSSRERLMIQIGYRLDLLQHTGGGDRSQLAGELSDLLERALAVHPSDEGLAFIQCELWLRELGRPADALALASRFVDQSGRFRALRRDAAAQVSVQALAGALLEDGLADGRKANATALARSIIKRVRAGEGYAEAERAVLRR